MTLTRRGLMQNGVPLPIKCHSAMFNLHFFSKLPKKLYMLIISTCVFHLKNIILFKNSHLQHKCRCIGFYVIFKANSREDLITDSKGSIISWHKATYLGHNLEQGYLFQVCRFTTLTRERVS